MAKKVNIDKMPITSVIKKFIEESGWDDEIVVDEDGDSRATGILTPGGQQHRYYMEGFEEQQAFKLYMYGPISVPGERKGEMAKLLNWINCDLYVGRFAILSDNKPSSVQFYAVIDVEGGKLVPKMIDTLIRQADRYFGTFATVMAAVALTKITAEKAIEEFLEASRAQEAEEETPDEL